MINVSLNELKLIAKSRSIKDYENKSEDDLIKIPSELKPKINISQKKIKEIKTDFSKLRQRFSKSKIIKFKRSPYNIKNLKNLSIPEIKETEKNLLELEKSLFRLKNYCDYDDTEYRGIRDIGNLLNGVALNGIDEDYHKPIKTKSSFTSNYIEYKSKGDKDRKLSIKKYIYMITPYSRDMINDHKTKTEWKIQSSTQINFTFSKDSEETRTMHTKSHNVEIMMGSKT